MPFVELVIGLCGWFEVAVEISYGVTAGCLNYPALCCSCWWSGKQQTSVTGKLAPTVSDLNTSAFIRAREADWGKLSIFFEFPTIWAAVIDAVSEKLTCPCVVPICVYIYVSKWSYVSASESNVKQLACVWSCVCSELVKPQIYFQCWCSSSCLELIREPDYRTDGYRTLVTLSLNLTHTWVCHAPTVFVLFHPSVATHTHTHKCAVGKFWIICHTHMSAVQIK